MARVEVIDNTDQTLRRKEEAIEQALEMIGLQAERYAKEIITAKKAVDTGRLRNSITHATANYSGVRTYSDNEGKSYSDATTKSSPRDNEVYIGTNVEYGPYIEFGTSRKNGAARPFLRPAAMNHTDEYKKIVEHCMKQNR